MIGTEGGAPRYALYYTTPEGHPLTEAAARWLGRDAFRGRSLPPADAGLTAEPRRYGFHATLKPPFRLREGASATELETAMQGFCRTHVACPIGRLRVERIGRFFALVPAQPLPTLGGLAGEVVSSFDGFRAPLNEAELAKRMRAPLDEVETTNLVRWGYPYVFDRFRFHMTLTGPVEPAQRDAVGRRLEAIFAPLLDEDFLLDALTLFVQDDPDADFMVRAQVPLWRPAARRAADG